MLTFLCKLTQIRIFTQILCKMIVMLSIYIHIPFCKKRCAYCDFITYADMQHFKDDYVQALVKEINGVKSTEFASEPVGTLYFGGGTPSLLSSRHFEDIINVVNKTFDISEIQEITVESNPGAINKSLLKTLKGLGVTRLSLGAQSFLDNDLLKLGRIHKSVDIYQTLDDARHVGFDNINLDLIFGLPDQTPEGWQKNLEKTAELSPEHLSLYSLILEEGTPLAAAVSAGSLSVPDDDICADMFEAAMAYLAQKNYDHYEISNWSKAGQYPSKHNMQYWHNEPYISFGAGAHSCIGGYRVENLIGIPEYINSLSNDLNDQSMLFSPANQNLTRIDNFTAMQETMMLGLRLVKEGVSESRFIKKYGISMFEMFSKEIMDLCNLGLLIKYYECSGAGVRLSERGILLGNQVFMRFV